MSTTTRQAAGGSSPVLCSWIWSLEPWTTSDLVPTVRFSVPITSSTSPAPGTTGRKVTTLGEPSLLTLCLML
ncbi:hypothetical protein LINGRAHAP2_LOCUS24827 [Linum grandiflorum]